MLSSSRTSRLCSRCRHDLLVIFERGFSGYCIARPVPITARPKKSRAEFLRRTLSYTPRRLQPTPDGVSTDDVGVSGSGHLAQNDTSDEHVATIRELEKALGKSLQDAIEEDQLAATFETNEPQKEQSAEDTAEVEARKDPIIAMRESGADVTQVAREARLIFGDSLPDGVLEEQEIKVYTRLYGEPEDDFGDDVDLEEPESQHEIEHQLLDRSGDPVEHIGVQPFHVRLQRRTRSEAEPEMDETYWEPAPNRQLDFSDSLQSGVRHIAASLDGEVTDDTAPGMEDDGKAYERSHPLTKLGKFETSPSTVSLPVQEFVEPFQVLMRDYSNKHLKEVCERSFGGGGLPDSPLTPRSGKLRPQVAVSLEASQNLMSQMEANAFMTAVVPPAYAAVTSVLVETRRRLGPTWLNELLSKDGGPRVLDAGAGGGGILAWNEIVKAHWDALHTSDKGTPTAPPSKTVVLTASDTLRHRATSYLENTTFIPHLPNYSRTRDSPTLQDDRPAQQRKQFDVVIAPYTLMPLKEDWEKKLYVQNLWSLVSSSGGVLILIEKGIPRGFEAIAGAREHLLKRYIRSPLSHSTHYNSTSDTETGASDEKGTGMIIGPCTNHTQCPLYKVPGKSQGRKDLCSFQQRYIRPPQLQRVLGAKDRNHDDVDFSYISVMKGRDLRQHHISTFEEMVDPLSAPVARATHAADLSPTPNDEWIDQCQDGFSSATTATTTTSTPNDIDSSTSTSTSYPPTHLLPRLLFPPIKRQGHILLDVCTPLGTLERWTVPRSFSKQAFRDARKASWGDLWGLGAKTRVPRTAKTGIATKEVRAMMAKMPGGGGGKGIGRGLDKGAVLGKGRSRNERLENQATKLIQKMEEEKEEERQEKREMEKDLAAEFNVPLSEVRSVIREDKAAESVYAPRRSLFHDNDEEDPAVEAALAAWEAEFASDKPSQRKKGGAFREQGVAKSSKAAKRLQTERWREAVKGKVPKDDEKE